jgi:hypothetical protein
VEVFAGVAGGREREARSIAAACSGLLAERGKIGLLALPAVNANVPWEAIATTLPRCRDSTNPDRITSASTGLATTSLTDNCSKGVTRDIMAGRCLPPAHISLISGAKSVNDLYGA